MSDKLGRIPVVRLPPAAVPSDSAFLDAVLKCCLLLWCSADGANDRGDDEFTDPFLRIVLQYFL